jgi:GNAT superfamily N-acetyltransferase
MRSQTAQPLRRLKPGDEPLIEQFLAGHAASSLVLRSNLRLVGLVDHGAPYQGTYAGAFENDRLVAVAGHFWNGVIALQAPTATEDVARAVFGWSGRTIAGLMGPWAQLMAARSALGLENLPTKYEGKDVLYAVALDRMRIPPALAAGTLTCRRSRQDDLSILTEWAIGYATELLGSDDNPATRSEEAERVRRGHEEERLYVVENSSVPVATCAFNANLPDTVQIGGVYTPPNLRRRGYARAVVAGSLRMAQRSGVTSGVLFTGEDNMWARRAYESLGFEAIGDYGLILFRT